MEKATSNIPPDRAERGHIMSTRYIYAKQYATACTFVTLYGEITALDSALRSKLVVLSDVSTANDTTLVQCVAFIAGNYKVENVAPRIRKGFGFKNVIPQLCEKAVQRYRMPAERFFAMAEAVENTDETDTDETDEN